jgi:hypothetical protein
MPESSLTAKNRPRPVRFARGVYSHEIMGVVLFFFEAAFPFAYLLHFLSCVATATLSKIRRKEAQRGTQGQASTGTYRFRDIFPVEPFSLFSGYENATFL